MKKYLGEIMLIITAMIWGSGFVASAIALEHYNPFQVLPVRFAIGVVLLSVIFHKRLRKLNRQVIVKGVIIGVFLYLAFALQINGLKFTTPSKNAFLTAVNVVIVPFIAFLIYRRKVDFHEVFGAVLALIGVGVMVLKLNTSINIGDLLTLGCAFAFAFHIYYTSRYVKDEDPVLLTIVQLFTASILGLIVIVFNGDLDYTMNYEGLTSLFYLGIFTTTIAYLLQTIAQRTVNETKTAIILSAESVWGMVFSIILLREVVTLQMIIGALIILSAILIAELKPNIFRRWRSP